MDPPRDIAETAREASAPASADFLPLDDSNDSDLRDTSDGEAGGGHEDSASDVSMAAESDDDGYDPATLLPDKPTATTGPAQGNAPPAAAAASRKRKSPGDGPGSHAPGPALPAESAKKVKLDGVDREDGASASILPGNKSLLPAEIWHHIFSFCPPRTLGSLLLVSRLFNVYLDPSSTIHCEHPAPLSQPVVPVVQPDTVWKRSRRLFWPGMPAPLRDRTELDMWKLSCSTSCQHCGKAPVQGPASPTDPSRPGPGLEGVALVWPFATRSCGPCLLKKSTKEIDILLSPSIPSALVPSLPFVLVSQELHAYSPALIERGQRPADTQVTKLFWTADVESMKQEFDEVKNLGVAAAEEWLKGLEGRGKARQTDSAKWENWTSTGGVAQMKTTLHPGYQKVEVTPAQAPAPPPKFQIPGLGSLAANPDTAHDAARLNSAPESTPRAESVSSNGASVLPSKTFSHGRQERTKEEVAELKAARKAEIERRCLLLDPPLPANVLAHIPSFQAAIQIIAPLDDKAWGLLLPRLLAQRAEAEERESQIADQARISQELAERQKMDGPKTTKEVLEADWDEVQAPVRARIARLADEISRKNWDGGDKVTKENSPRFAAEVLIYVRERFYAETAQEADTARAAGREPPADPVGGPFTQKLTLENMKWIFDTKIKPHTEPYRKELFICNGCENNGRYYGFEGVIQHYAAKHTSILSSGNIVVHWRAEWPEHPPFNPEGRPGRNQHYGQGPGRGYASNSGPAPPRYGYNAYQSAPPAGPPPGPYSSYTAGPSYSGAGYGEQYPQPAQPPYPPQGGYGPQGYGPAPYGPDPYTPYPNAPAPAAPYHASSQAPPQAFAGPGSAPPAPASAPAPAAGQYGYNYGAYQAHRQAGFPMPQAASHPGQFKRQLEDMARSARELWNATSNMKDVPGSVRVFVVIHHISKGFHAKFGETPSLSMFVEGLSNNKDMRPVRNINGLMCKVCHLRLGGYAATDQEKKSFSLPQLANHFQSKHVEPFMQMGQHTAPPDWVTDMVLLPDPSVLSRLRTAVGMDSQKQFLVSDALPQAFGSAAPAPGPAHAQSAWQAGESYPRSYQGASSDHGQYYAPPPHANEPASASHTAAPHQSAVASYDQYPNQPYSADASYQPWFGGAAPSQAAPFQAEPAPPPAAARPQPETSNKMRNTSYGKQGGNDRKSSQGFRQSRDQQRQNKKNKKAGGGGRAPANTEAETAKLTEEEAKLAEEEERRREEEIRAMWAADRAETARKSTRPEDRQAKGPPGRPPVTGPSSTHTSKTHTPRQRQRAPSVPRPSNPRPKEEPGLMDALEMHLSKPPSPPYQERAYGPPPASAVYADDRQQIGPPAARRTPERLARYDDPRPAAPRARSRSPVIYGYGRPAPAQAYLERSPPPPLPRHAAPPYQGVPEPMPLDGVRYELPPPRDDYYARGYADEPPRGPPPRVKEYVELVEVRDSQGTYYIERPVRRQPEPERYHAPYEGERPIRREVGPYPPYERAYSRAPAAGPVYEPRPPPVARQGPPPAGISRDDPAYYEEYDPHFPAAPPGNPPRPVRYQ